MKLSSKVAALAAGAVGCAGIALWVSAGNLDPPPGDVSPTMVTLEDLNAQMAALGAPKEWDTHYLVLNTVGPSHSTIVGSGVIHAVVVTSFDGSLTLTIWDSPANPTGAEPIISTIGIPAAKQSFYHELDVRYNGGIGLYKQSTGQMNMVIYYKPDAP